MGAVTFSIDPKLVELFKKVLPLKVFVETGTFKGDTLASVRRNFEKIYSVELSTEYYEQARDRFRDDPGIEIIHGDSSEKLAGMVSALTEESALYWLDSHWCVADNTAGQQSQCPLIAELAAIKSLNAKSVIMIDDARYFLAPPQALFSISDWPVFTDVLRALESLSAGHRIMILNDCILFYPPGVEGAIKEYARANGVDWLSVLDKSRDYDIVARQLIEKEDLILSQDLSLKEKDDLIQTQESSLKEKDDLIQTQESSLKEKEDFIQTQESSLKKKDDFIQTQESSLKKKDDLIQTQESSLKEKDDLIQTQESSLKKKDDFIQTQESSLKEKDDLIQTQESSLKEKEDFIQSQERRCRAFQELLQPQTWSVISQKALDGSPVADGLAKKKAPNSRVASALMWCDRVYVRLFRPRLMWLDTCYARFFKPRLTWLASVARLFKPRLTWLASVARLFKPRLTWIASVYSRLSRLRQILSVSVASFFSPKLGAFFHYPPRSMEIPNRYLSATPPGKQLTVSIVTPSYNHADFIERTMKSVLDQGYPWLEYIVQDGGSKDGTVAILERYADRLARWDSAKDNGQGDAINLGFGHTTGEIMAYLNSDDVLLPGTLNYVTSFFERRPDVDVVYGHRVIINENDLETGRWVMPPHDDAILEWADYVPQETMFWRRRIWDKAGGGMDLSFQFALDWDLIMRFRAAGAKFVRLPRFLAAFRVHMRQKTLTDMGSTGAEEMGRIRERCHGRSVSGVEINEHISPYLKRHVIFQKLYDMGILRY